MLLNFLLHCEFDVLDAGSGNVETICDLAEIINRVTMWQDCLR